MLSKSNIKKIQSILGKDNVLISKEECYSYSVDACNTYENTGIADVIVFVETVEQVQQIVEFAYKNSIPIIPRGAGTNMVGSCVCDEGGIVVNFSKMNKIIEFNLQNMSIKVQPGVVLNDIKIECEKQNLYFPPNPSNYKVSTIGGAIAQASAGAYALKYGTIKDYVLSLKVVMPNGSLVKFGTDLIKNSVGYQMQQLFIGSEGTLGVVVEATLKLIPKPAKTSVVLVYFNSVVSAVYATNRILESGILPSAIDFMDNTSIQTVEDFKNIGLDTDAKAMLLIDIDGENSYIDAQLKKIKGVLNEFDLRGVYSSVNHDEYEKYWEARRSSYSAVTRLAPDVVSDDIIVPRDKIINAVDFCQKLSDKYSLKMCLIGHLGDGNLHPQIALDLTNEDVRKRFNAFRRELYQETVKMGGMFSGEHGIGLEKKSYIEMAVDKNSLNYMKLIKRTIDPKNIMNPRKIFEL